MTPVTKESNLYASDLCDPSNPYCLYFVLAQRPLCPSCSNAFTCMADATTTSIPEALANAVTQNGTTLAALSEQSPVLLVFLRQFG